MTEEKIVYLKAYKAGFMSSQTVGLACAMELKQKIGLLLDDGTVESGERYEKITEAIENHVKVFEQ
jgi:hypothetical protein